MTSIRIPQGTSITVSGAASSFDTASELDGAVVLEEEGSESDDRYVFLAGYGVALVPKLAPRTKKARLDETVSRRRAAPTESGGKSSFTAFKIRSTRGDTVSQAALPQLLDVIGHLLTSLRVKIPNVDEEMAERMLRSCPNLCHLTLANTTVSTMKVIEDGYARGTPLSSLALKQWHAPVSEFEKFLKVLRDEQSPISKTLRRLRIGKRWPTAFTAETHKIIEGVLQDNTLLAHVGFYSSGWDDNATKIVHTHHGAIVAGHGVPLASRSQWAFFEGVHNMAKKNPRLELNDLVKAAIVQFAAQSQRREVICWEDLLMGGGNPLMRFHQW